MQLPDDITWSNEKNELLKFIRGVSFDDVEDVIERDAVLLTEPHPNQTKYPGQLRMYVIIRDYVYMVPFVIDRSRNHIFLKTIIPSRTFTKKYLSK